MPLRNASWFRCFGCAPDNPRGLRLDPRRVDGGGAECHVRFDEDFCSYPGIVHGGIIGAAADDLMANLILMECRVLALSTSLRTRFVRPVLVDKPYRIVARLTGSWAGGYAAEADVCDETGDACALVAGTFATARPEQMRALVTVDPQEQEQLSAYLVGVDR
ncbi:PaaI family thioesterase [Allokutzneria sp. A3M-2-11 16]|uniref:PaaI family thioesterase n=1 Tax=Allokutzneria sp. A3M-2-11 16 TaxID=2962043 RepID=UPI0020B83685|nr:PaaI family thioesterase [Allokutzneria sp. A3M-2-11 16]MCP3802918.1 PaaI family thioesterase [Allokutzneria sp. A3M-2-11 16]